MSETEEDEENKKEKPSWIVEYGNEGHDNDGDEENNSTSPSEKGIGNVASVQLSDRKEVEGSDKKANPSCIPYGMKKDIIIFRNLTHD